MYERQRGQKDKIKMARDKSKRPGINGCGNPAVVL
jgi:hypothetical protein